MPTLFKIGSSWAGGAGRGLRRPRHQSSFAVRECFRPTPNGLTPTPENVLGVLSLIFWALTLVVIVKYLTVVMRADNHGEGGILALSGTAPRPAPPPTRPTEHAVFSGDRLSPRWRSSAPPCCWPTA